MDIPLYRYPSDKPQPYDDVFGEPLAKIDERVDLMKPFYEQGVVDYNNEKYEQAREAFTKAARVLVDDAFPFPSIGTIGFTRDFYKKMPIVNKEFLMTLCLLFVQCCQPGEDDSIVLAWLQELNTVLAHSFLRFPLSVKREWQQHKMIWKKYSEHVNQVRVLIHTAVAARCLFNTAACHHALTRLDMYLPELSDEDRPTYAGVASDDSPRYLLHPSKDWFPPRRYYSALNVMGRWKKLPVKPSGKMGRRHSCSGFVWKGHLYIIGGSRHDDLSSDTRDVWRLNLENTTEWDYVCQYPVSVREYSHFRNRDTHVYEDKAYLFTGRPQLDVLDLVTLKWSTLVTTWVATEDDKEAMIRPDWPWYHNMCEGACQQIIQGRLFVFGGLNGDTPTGSNLLMVLDLKTLQWRRLSGHTFVCDNHDENIPGPRWGASSWVSKDQDRFYIIFGQCNKMTESITYEDFAPKETWVYEDMWSWDIRQEKWRRERVLGNAPSARNAFGCVYSEILDKVVIFGGENPVWSKNLLQTDPKDPRSLPGRVCYLADTFIYQPLRREVVQAALDAERDGMKSPLDGDDLKWKQVLTPGFPTWRSHMQLICDQSTGRIYMYGGVVRTDVIPTHSKSKTRAFGDLWELHIDIPGGHFETVDTEEEARTAAVGSRQRCFNCCKVGYWKKCGGTCRGRAFFCEPECLKLGWERHKEMHYCRKE